MRSGKRPVRTRRRLRRDGSTMKRWTRASVAQGLASMHRIGRIEPARRSVGPVGDQGHGDSGHSPFRCRPRHGLCRDPGAADRHGGLRRLGRSRQSQAPAQPPPDPPARPAQRAVLPAGLRTDRILRRRVPPDRPRGPRRICPGGCRRGGRLLPRKAPLHQWQLRRSQLLSADQPAPERAEGTARHLRLRHLLPGGPPAALWHHQRTPRRRRPLPT